MNEIKIKKNENPWLSLTFNVLIPSIILMKMSSAERLGPTVGLIVALAFPLGYSIWDFVARRKFSFIAALGFVAILTKGGLGLFQLNHFWFAVNEAAVPTIVAAALWVSVLMGKPLVGYFLLNDAVMNVDVINQHIADKKQEHRFAGILGQATYLLILSFLVSAILNFALAIYMLKSPVGSEAFNEEMGVMTAASLPIILICSTSIMVVALWRMLKQLKEITGLEIEAMFKK